MSAGFEVRNHSTKAGTAEPEAMFTIQVLVDTDWSTFDVERAQAALTATYASAFDELTARAEGLR